MNFKRLYKNGDFRLLGSRNLYGQWNTLMWKLTKLTTPKPPIKMKVSFDFDSTLDREDVQAFAINLMNQGVEVWVTTSRGDDKEMLSKRANPEVWKNPPNHDLWMVTELLGIPKEQVQFTAWVDKWTVLNGKGFIWHLDDDEIELEQMIINDSEVVGINVEQAFWLNKAEDELVKINKNYKTDWS